MIKGKTKSGFTYQIPEENLNNYELVEYIEDLEENPLVVVKIVNMLLGKEQATKLKEHVRSKDGLVPVEKMSDELAEIFRKEAEIKK